MNHIICFYWQGDRWQGKEGHVPADSSYRNHLKRIGTVSTDLASKYVNNLFRGASRWTQLSFKFICFTNEPLTLDSGIEVRSFKQVTTKGVLPRMYMFSEAAGLFGSQVLCLDIDVVITGSLDPLLKYEGLFCTRRSWTRGEETLIDGDIMSFKAGRTTEVMFWDPLVTNMDHVDKVSEGGRERFWVRHVLNGKIVDTWQEFCPGKVHSYKHHIRPAGGIIEGTSIISCHGHPRPHQIEDKWITEYWK
jgi:hypothetical protein